jgi:hypothetical protein
MTTGPDSFVGACAASQGVFPGTATVESDFSMLKWEYDEFRSTLSELSLKGIVLCRRGLHV